MNTYTGRIFLPARHRFILHHTVLGAALAVLFLNAAFVSAQEAAPETPGTEPHLVFKKTVVVKDYSDGKTHAEEHVIRKGEHLWKILREQYNMSDTSINFFCKIARAVNPDIQDLNVLHPDQDILLPFKFIPGDGTDNRTIMIGTQDYRHTVISGEHLGHILRSRFGLPDNVIFNRITKSLIYEANPTISDLNAISPGQTITIPREVFAMQQIVEHGVLPQEKIPPASAPESPPDNATRIALEGSFTEEPLNDDEQEIKRMLSSMTRQFDGTDNSTGVEVITSGPDAAVRLDYKKFPAYTFPWGKKVVLDYGDRLSADTRKAISGRWNNAEVVSVQARDDMETIIGRVLDVCGFYKVEKDADYTVSRDAVQLSVTGNWIVFRDSSLRKVFVVNLARDGNPSINPSLRSYLSGIGLDIMDIGAVENNDPAGTDNRTSRVPRAAFTEIAAPSALTDTILRLLGHDFQMHYKTDIFQNMYSGVSLEVVADRMFTKNGQVHLIDFSNLPSRIADIIKQKGFKLLQIDPGTETMESLAGRVLEFCEADFQAPPATIGFDNGERENVRLTVPGYLIQTPGGRTLLTGTDINESISVFLREKDIAIVKY